MKFLEGWGRGPRNSWLDVGGNADHGPEPEIILKGFFILFPIVAITTDSQE